jgi:hypothetical protein
MNGCLCSGNKIAEARCRQAVGCSYSVLECPLLVALDLASPWGACSLVRLINMAVKMEQSRSMPCCVARHQKRPWRGRALRIARGEARCEQPLHRRGTARKKQHLGSHCGVGSRDDIAAKSYHTLVAAWCHGVAG